MGGFNQTESLNELLKDVPLILKEVLGALPPVLIAHGRDSRWTNLWDFIARKKCNLENKRLLDCWKQGSLSTKNPFTETILTQIDTANRKEKALCASEK